MVDIACSIAENYKILSELTGTQKDYVWACGGGLQSATLRRLLAGLMNKKVQVRHGFEQSSVVGGALLCNEALNAKAVFDDTVETVEPQDDYEEIYKAWKNTRTNFKNMKP
jgi:Sugar (pentulose and hexulose) kinases